MVFNDTTTRQGLIQDCEDLCNLGATGISGNTTLLQTFTRFINQWYLKSVAWLLEADTRWQWDDSNYTDLPRGTANLVASQKDYTLPAATTNGNFSTFLRLLKIAVLDTGSQEIILQPTEESEASLNQKYSSSGIPAVYRLTGNSLKMWPAPASGSVTLTAGLVVYYQRSPDPFATTDTTQQPGIPEPFHRLLSMGASYDYGTSKGLQNAPALRQEVEQMKQQMQSFYQGRNQDSRLGLRKHRTAYN